ncbi:peptide-N(4)-(N-acetyl-beta-glucosaminyl)asparagine amidase A [Ceratobasidium sp. AG-Ba]|nr:peptide-N(4)-(N-acetyl-beta-glucosaminyl)asparagine amidase A [Ceratobasidium sp. AG-Ba]
MFPEACNNEKRSAALSLIGWAADAWTFMSSPASTVSCEANTCKMVSSKLSLLLSMLSLGSQARLSTRQSANTTAPLVNFQVTQPPITPKVGKSCTVELFRHTFANSYYQPEIIEYTPPTNCGKIGEWAGVSLNWTATSQGRQYDRLAAVTFQNVEIWRTSTAEPTTTGIIWTHLKDVTKYIPLFAKPGRMIVDLNNIVDASLGLNGEYDGKRAFVRFSATFFEPTLVTPSAPKSDLIIPLSNLSPDQANYAAVPPSLNTTVLFPRNAAKAFVEIFASGNSAEEFWYFNLADSWIPKLPSGTTYGKGAYREASIESFAAGLACSLMENWLES